MNAMGVSAFWRFCASVGCIVACVLAGVALAATPALAISTGSITGTITAAAGGAPVAGASVSAVAPSGTYKTTTDSHGFYSIVNMTSDTYTVTASADGYDSTVIAGVTVFQDQGLVVNAKLSPRVGTLGRVTVNAAKTNLVQPNLTSNTYNVTLAQQNTVLGDTTHHTLYDVLWRTPGITSGPTSNSPIVRGGTTTEVGWEFEEIPIVDRTVGFYTTELSTTGIGNVAVTTGGLSADQGGSNGGIINMVVNQGTYPQKGWVTFGVGGPAYDHTLDLSYGTATPDNRWSFYVAGSYTNVDQLIGNSPNTFYYENIEGFDWVNTKDTTGNLHYKWGDRNQNDLQYVFQSGVGIFRPSYGGNQGSQLAAVGEVADTTSPGCSVALPCPGPVLLALKMNADSWYHYYNIQKIAYNRTINDRSFLRLRVAQSNNGYFFDEEWAQNVGEPCPFGPCTFGQPAFGQGYFSPFDLWCYGCYYQDRHTLQTFTNADYGNQIGQNNLIKVGVGFEYDKNFRKVADCCPPATDPTTGVFLGWPFYDRITLAPTAIYSAYASDHITAGKWVFEPGVRWDHEHYSISPVQAGGVNVVGTATPFSESFVSPRFAMTYQAGASDVFRASYGHLGQFIGTAYAENFGPAMHFDVNDRASFSPQKPAVATSYDLSWEHLFPHDLSLRVTPYVHNNVDYVVEYTLFKGNTVFTNGGATKTRGVEVGLSREVNDGLSTFLSFTYDDTKSNVLNLAGPYFGSFGSTRVFANIQANNFLPATYSAPWSSNLALDWKHAGWEINSNTLWSTAFPYGLGRNAYDLDSSGNVVLVPLTRTPTTFVAGASCRQFASGQFGCLDPNEGAKSFAQDLRGPAWFLENLYISHSVGIGRVGVSALNLFNNIWSPVPAVDGRYLHQDGTGSWAPQGDCPLPSQWPPQSFISCHDAIYPAPNAYVYPVTGYYRQQNQTPRQILVWYKLNVF